MNSGFKIENTHVLESENFSYGFSVRILTRFLVN